MLFNTLNLIYLNVTMPNLTRKIFTQISLAGLYFPFHFHTLLFIYYFMMQMVTKCGGGRA